MVWDPDYFDADDEDLKREYAGTYFFRCCDGLCGQLDCSRCHPEILSEKKKEVENEPRDSCPLAGEDSCG